MKGIVIVTDRGATTTMAYDGRGRLVSATLPDTSVTTILHGLGSDTATVQSNSNGNITRTFNYDTRGFLLNVRNEVAIPRNLFADILRLIAELRPAARCGARVKSLVVMLSSETHRRDASG